MSLNRAELGLVVEELAPALQGGWIQAVHQPAERTLVLEIRVPGQTRRLLLCCDPHTARLHLITQKLPNPDTPPPFCRFLRAHVQSARIDEIRQIAGDRIVELALTSRNGPRTLTCNFTGNHANILVLDSNRNVLSALHDQRRLTGHPYVPPARRTVEPERPLPVRFSALPGGSPCPVSAALEAHYRDEDARLIADRAKGARTRHLRSVLKRTRRRIEAWEGDLAKARQYRGYARYGELLKTNLGSIRKGADRVTLVDYFDHAMPHVTIPLDADKSPHANMEEYFRKHRKCLAAESELTPRIERARQELERVERELSAIEQGIWTQPEPTPPVTTAAGRSGGRRRTKCNLDQQGPYRRFISSDGLPIFVGRNARENDQLTFGLAKSEDLWLHARGIPGSHVVVRLEKGKDVPAETLKDAAVLALLYSDLRKSGKGDVIYTRRKWVRKAKGGAPGSVLVTQEQSLHTNLDKTRLAALKARMEHPE
jgi:predicted ribosome quality control (RQC) complex YloA/Tae2 family protein